MGHIDKAAAAAYQREYRARRRAAGNPVKRKPHELDVAWQRKAKYGIDNDTYLAMRAGQGDQCAICRIDFAPENVKHGRNSNCVVDHCHDTNKVRGLLCPRCNAGLGQFRDNPDFLRSAIEYLKA